MPEMIQNEEEIVTNDTFDYVSLSVHPRTDHLLTMGGDRIK